MQININQLKTTRLMLHFISHDDMWDDYIDVTGEDSVSTFANSLTRSIITLSTPSEVI